jgi:hypothetical protein
VAALAFLACLLTVVMNPSLTAGLGKLPADAADRMFQSWQLAWNGHGLLHQPLDFFDSNAFWPLENSVAFSDALIGFTPAGLFGSGPEAALVRYNLVFLFCYASAFLAASLLGREIGLGWPAALVAGAAFGFAPFRLTHYNHLHVLASGPIPLTLFLLLRGYRRARPGMVIGGFAVATWQVSIGFTLGVPLAYLLGFLAVVAGVFGRRERRPAPGRPVVVATVVGLGLLVAWSGAQAVPYLRVLEEHPEAERTTEYVRFYSPPPHSFLVAPAESLLWGEPTGGLREQVTWAPEMALFPGLTVLALAAIGLASGPLSRRWRAGLAAGAAGSAVLALGYSFFGGAFTYNLLYELAPGWQGSRTPGRLFTFTSLALALLAGAGVSALRTRSGRTGRLGEGSASAGPAGPARVPRRAAAAALPAVLLLAVLAEGLGRPPVLADPPLRALPADEPQMHLPSDDFNDFVYMFWSTAGFPDIVNGYSGFTPALLGNLRSDLRQFPDAATVARLEELGVRTVVLHVDRAAGTPWAGAHLRPVDGLSLRRVVEGQTVRFDLDAAPEGAG